MLFLFKNSILVLNVRKGLDIPVTSSLNIRLLSSIKIFNGLIFLNYDCCTKRVFSDIYKSEYLKVSIKFVSFISLICPVPVIPTIPPICIFYFFIFSIYSFFYIKNVLS